MAVIIFRVVQEKCIRHVHVQPTALAAVKRSQKGFKQNPQFVDTWLHGNDQQTRKARATIQKHTMPRNAQIQDLVRYLHRQKPWCESESTMFCIPINTSGLISAIFARKNKSQQNAGLPRCSMCTDPPTNNSGSSLLYLVS